MLTGLEMLGLITGGLSALGVVESALHRRNLSRVPWRIHVGGTRGKSSVTRLIAAGLREAGVPTAAKTTGTLPRLILPDARELPVSRSAGPNIIEQARIVGAAANLGVKALVVECMALQPELHWVSERKLVRATHCVITNARSDHLDVMGPGERDVALALAGMIPPGGVVYTAEQRYLDVLRYAAGDRGARLVALEEEEVAAVTEEDLAGFGYVEHAENVALALKVLGDLEVSRETALAGMRRAQPDPGALTEYTLEFFGRRIVFVNGFAANDPESTEKIWRLSLERHAGLDRVTAVFNLRSDRPHRTLQLARETSFWRDADGIVLIGSGAYLFARMAALAGFDPGRMVLVERDSPDEVFESILDVCGPSTLVVGMGNIGGLGLPIVRYFRNRSLQRL